jgi:hypothetical protein
VSRRSWLTDERPLNRTYVLRCRETGRFKIGRSTQPDQRIRTLRLVSPTELDFVGFLDADETDVHRALAEHRLHGEWFAPIHIANHLNVGSLTWNEYLWLVNIGLAQPPVWQPTTEQETA